MNISPETYVSEIVRMNFRTAPLFQANKIDFCCGGDKSIAEACKAAGISQEHLIRQLEQVAEQGDPDSEYIDSLTLDELSDYIISRHHAYVKRSIPLLIKNMEKIGKVHGDEYPELFRIRDLFSVSAGNLIAHMQKEEIMLFPFIRRLESAKREKLPVPRAPFGSVSNPITMMMDEHQHEGDRFNEISKLSQNYRLPDDACATYVVAFNQLRDFEEDLHRHIHLENNILFPKAVEMERI